MNVYGWIINYDLPTHAPCWAISLYLEEHRTDNSFKMSQIFYIILRWNLSLKFSDKSGLLNKILDPDHLLSLTHFQEVPQHQNETNPPKNRFLNIISFFTFSSNFTII